jgi:fido (protein-threonine AMPylation protein)
VTSGTRPAPTGVLEELRLAVLEGRWHEVAGWCGVIIPTVERESVLLAQLSIQATLHEHAVEALQTASHSSSGVTDRLAVNSDTASQLVRALRRNFAALDGDHRNADALLRDYAPADVFVDLCEAAIPRHVRSLGRSEQIPGVLRVLGVVRPSAEDGFAIGDAASPTTVPLAGTDELLPRGTPIEVAGTWDPGRRILHSQGIVTLAEVPDYDRASAMVEELCALAGLAAEPMQVRVVPSSKLDQSVVKRRITRRDGEWDTTLQAAEIFEDALSDSQLSLETLARVHQIVVGGATANAGQLRRTPAVIRWHGVITYRTPPVSTARAQTVSYLRTLTAELKEDYPRSHPASLAATAVASLTTSHPFTDGNGRVGRALATWLLLRSGFQRRSQATLSTFLDAHLDEHYKTLRNFPVSPWGWHQLFCDAALATFQPVALDGSGSIAALGR